MSPATIGVAGRGFHRVGNFAGKLVTRMGNRAMNDMGGKERRDRGRRVSRRSFLQGSKNVTVAAVVGGTLSGIVWLDDAVAAIPASEGYLLVDTKKCQGCAKCMLACSLVHEGVESLHLARIQVIQKPFK